MFLRFLIVQFKNGHNGVIGKVNQGITDRFILDFLNLGFGQALEPGHLIPKPDPGHCHSFFREGLVKAVTIVMIFHGVQGIDFLANIGMAFRFGFR